jgi:hypothetical protein
MLFSGKKLNLLVLVFALAICSLFSSSVFGWSKDYLLELTIITDKQEEFVDIQELTERQMRAIKQDPNSGIKDYLLAARKKYADEIGYRKEIYGEENYKMVVITRYKFIVRDKSSGRILVKK